MAAFRFRLSTLLRLRENLRDECRQQLSAAQKAEEILVNRIAELNDHLTELRKQSRVASQPGSVNVDRLLDAGRYEIMLKAQRQAVDEQWQVVQSEVERRRQSLVEADREVKTIEKLRDQQITRHRQKENRQEVKQLDASAIQQTFAKEEN
ncbi:MAG TPA: flagellar export protein FliJ [Pirellulales bacterium]|jgi:flagellar export protein FliJ|nr:flagellar export protein FliJ [Pirellulales bacterium]